MRILQKSLNVVENRAGMMSSNELSSIMGSKAEAVAKNCAILLTKLNLPARKPASLKSRRALFAYLEDNRSGLSFVPKFTN
jgi:short-subunit dehydrogenase involved in D-alanine esterification of teichoic acids